MNKSKKTLGQALIKDWKRELKIGDPKRILRLFYPTTVMYILAHFIIVPVMRAYYWLRNLVIRGLNYLGAWTGFHINVRQKTTKNQY